MQMPGWQSIHTPRHTAAHISLFGEGDGTLILGDASARLIRSGSSPWRDPIPAVMWNTLGGCELCDPYRSSPRVDCTHRLNESDTA